MKGLVITGIVAILTFCILDTAAGLRVHVPSYPSHRKLSLKRRTVIASSTCGKGEIFDRKNCNNKYVPKKAIDNSRNSAWVSQRLDSSRENITFTIDLDQQYYLREIRVLSGPTSHPMAWEVQVSADGEVYRTLVYFVPSPSNCPPDTHYIRNLAGSPGSVADGVPICSDQPRHLLDAGGLTDKTAYKIPLMSPYMGGARNSLNPALMAFLKARYVRLFFKFVEPPEIKVSPTRFISIGDLSVWAICGCNGFAAQCLEDPVTSRYTCQCEGHTCGTDCSSCCPGYGGAEFMSFDSGNGTTCQECKCNGHATTCHFDPEAGTSVCNNCTNATAGPHCEVCADGYYRSSVDEPCQECNCFEENSNGKTCDDKGQCDCLPGYEGLKCSTCEEGKVFNTFTRTCQECACNPEGTDKCENGTCVCAEEFTGGLCNRCQDGYYGYPNCRDCGCQSDPSVLVLGVCDPVSGQCPCPANRHGRRCESCDFGYYGNNVAQPCQPCNCNMNGSLLTTCNAVTGKCICKVGYKGLKCDGNSDEFFGFPRANQCDCDIRGSVDNICDKKIGQCPCREGAIGRRCDQCEDGTYPSLQGGCASCECSPIGAVSLNCTINGRCSCKEGVGGQNCETCLPGYWNFGQNGCQSCSCNRTGTDPRQICDALSGDCICVAEHAGEMCGECNTTRLHIATGDGCEICGDCVEPLVNTTDTVITLLNKTIELLPNLTIRIGRFDLVYVERNISIFSAFLELWSRDVHSIEIALGLVEGPPLVPGTFILDIRPPLLTQHSELREIVNTSTEFVGLDEFGRMVAGTTGTTFSFSSELNSKYSSLRMTVQELATYLEELQKMLQENFERVRDKEIEANRVNDIVKNRNFNRTAREVVDHLIKATSHFSESEHLETEAQSFFNLANREVNKFISGDVEGRLTTALEWLSNASNMIENTKSENAAIPPLQDRIDEHLPVADDLYQEDKQNLSVLTEAVVDNEAQLAGSLFTFSEAQMNYLRALELFGSLNRSTNSFEERLYDVIPDPNRELRAEIHATEIFENGSEIHRSSKDLLNRTTLFLKSLPPIPDVNFMSLEHTLEVAVQQSSSADSQVKSADLANLLAEVVDANITSYSLLKEALEYEDNSTDVKSLVDDVEMRYALAENWASTLEDRLSAVSAGLDELEDKPDFTGNFSSIRSSLETSNTTTQAVNSTLEKITSAVPSIQSDITVSRNNTNVIHENVNASRFLLDSLPSQVDQTNVTMMAVDGAIDALMDTNEDIISEIDDIIIGLSSVHNMLQKVNAPAIFESSDRDPRPYLSLQPPDKSEIGTPVLFEVIDLYLVPNGLSTQGALLFYAGPAWKKDDLNYTREMKEETFIALTASRQQLTLHYKLKMCEGGRECVTSGEGMLNHPRGQLLDVVPNHVQIMRIGNQLRLVRRRGGDNGASKMSTTSEQEGQLLFIPSPRTVYYIGGQPGDVKIYDSVDGYESYSGNINLLMYNRKEWSVWNIRDSSPTQFWLYTNNRKKGNTLVTKDISESELLSFDGSGYLYTERLGGGVNRLIRTTGGGNSELVFSISARSLDGLIVFMYEPSERMSLEVSLTNGVVMLQIVDFSQKKNGTLHFHLTRQNLQLVVQQYKIASGYLINIIAPDLSPTAFTMKNYFRETTDTQVWFGGYVEDIADNLRKKNGEEVAYVPKVKTSFKGSISVGLKEPSDTNSQDIFVTSINTFREYYINSDHQHGVSRTFIKQPFVDEVGFTGQSYLTFKDVRLQGLIDIQEYRPSMFVDSYALLFRTDRPQGGVLFHAESKTSGLLLFFEDRVVKVNLTHSGEVFTMSSSAPVVEANQWHSVFIYVSFTSREPVFKLFVDNKLEQEVAGLEGWRVHQSDVSFMISGLTLGGSPSVQTDNFSGCIKDFIVQENPFDAFTNTISSQQPAQSNETLPGLSDIVGVTFYECPVLEKHRPEEPYPVLLEVVEDYCVPAEDVKMAPFSLGGFRRSTSLTTSSIIPLLERNFVITFNITFYDDREIASITSGHDQTTSSDGYRHIFSLTSKYDEIVSVVLNADHNLVMAVRRKSDVQEMVLKSSVTENVNVELSCSGLDDVFTCSFNGMPAVMVARREYFHPNWPMVFGKATAMENAMGEPLDSFIGCLGDFSISGVPHSNLHTGQPCFDDATPGYYFNGAAYIAVSNASREVSFTFKAIRKDGLLAAILEKMDDGSFKVKVAIGYRAGALSAVSSGTEGVLLLEEESSSGCGLLSNLTVTPDEELVGIVFCEGTMCHSTVTLGVSVSTNDHLYIGGIPNDVEIEDLDLFLFLKPIEVSPMRLPPFFVGTLYPPLPTDPELELNNVNLGTTP